MPAASTWLASVRSGVGSFPITASGHCSHLTVISTSSEAFEIANTIHKYHSELVVTLLDPWRVVSPPMRFQVHMGQMPPCPPKATVQHAAQGFSYIDHKCFPRCLDTLL